MKRKYSKVDWNTLAAGYKMGLSCEQLAILMGRFYPEQADKTKSVRVLVSMLLTNGYTNSDGYHITVTKRGN